MVSNNFVLIKNFTLLAQTNGFATFATTTIQSTFDAGFNVLLFTAKSPTSGSNELNSSTIVETLKTEEHAISNYR